MKIFYCKTCAGIKKKVKKCNKKHIVYIYVDLLSQRGNKTIFFFIFYASSAYLFCSIYLLYIYMDRCLYIYFYILHNIYAPHTIHMYYIIICLCIYYVIRYIYTYIYYTHIHTIIIYNIHIHLFIQTK